MRRTWAIRALVFLAVLGLTGTAASADNGPSFFAAKLSGFNEVPPIQTNGSGTFTAVVRGDTLTYRLTFSGLTSAPTQSHLHFAQRGVNGGVFLFLCGTATNPGPAGTPTCPAAGGTVTRTVTAADFLAVPTQNVKAGDFQGALRLLRSGDVYANVHSANFPTGEIRGQVNFGFGDD
jgi:CHRD domain